MAQTKRKRRSKHRGNAAGTIQARGRTGRPLNAQERKKQTRDDVRQRRLNTPPTWRASLLRASFASAILFIFLLVTAKKHNVFQAAAFAVFALIVYVPAGFYMERLLFRRRLRRREQGK
jgi:hypothetical protein